MENHFENSDGKYIITGIFMLLFERMHSLRGLENTMMDFYLERKKIEMLADRIMEFHIRVIENISDRFPGRIHGLSFTDDWGTERALLINPELWREFFKPRYKQIFDKAKGAGWHIWMHSWNVINLQQPRALGIEEIGKEFQGRICFSSLCDIQHTLPFKNGKDIREEAHLLLKHWAAPEGGFILSDYGDGNAIGVDNEKKKIMLDAFLEFDPFKRN
jgi:hypothetical protein